MRPPDNPRKNENCQNRETRLLFGRVQQTEQHDYDLAFAINPRTPTPPTDRARRFCLPESRSSRGNEAPDKKSEPPHVGCYNQKNNLCPKKIKTNNRCSRTRNAKH